MNIDFNNLNQKDIDKIKEIAFKISGEKNSFRAYGTSRIKNKDLISVYEGLEITTDLLVSAMNFILESQKELDF